MTLGSFMLVRNENQWIAGHLEAWLPVLSEMVFFDGNSKDGTLEIIEHFRDNDPNGHKIRLFKNKDPKDLAEDYTRLFNEALHCLTTDMAAFIHPDMIPSKVPANFDHLDGAIAASVKIRSFAGEPGGQLLEIIQGRTDNWKSIYRLRNPDLGAHYFGAYGAWNEDVYFSAITSGKHEFHVDIRSYPYPVVDSGLEILHFSDVRPYDRRKSRMVSCLKNNNWPEDRMAEEVKNHPRVTLKDGDGFKFVPSEYPADFLKAQAKYKHFAKEIKTCLPV